MHQEGNSSLFAKKHFRRGFHAGPMSNAASLRGRKPRSDLPWRRRNSSHLCSAGVQDHMGEENLHVAAMQLWCYSSGTANLTDADFEHLLFCPQCQSLLDEFITILDQLPSVNPNQAA